MRKEEEHLRSQSVFSAQSIRNLSLLAAITCICGACSLVKEHTSPETYNMLTFNDGGTKEARLATVAYSQGKFSEAENHVINALNDNPKNPQALMVGALVYEQLGRPNRARQYYEDLMIYGGDATTVLGSQGGTPVKMTELAQKRLRLINVKQSKLVIEDQNGTKVFNISKEAGKAQRRSAIEEALFLREKRNIANQQPSTAEELQAVEVLFSEPEQNVISRFLILKELAEKDLVTKEEFLNARNTNIGGLLPLTHTPPAYGVDKSVPSPDLIIERINALKEAVESRAITPREFSAERDVIIEALLPPTPRQRMKPKAPSRDILGAAKDLRKLEILYDLQLITSKEKAKEKQAIEKYLGVNRAPSTKAATANNSAQPAPQTAPTTAPTIGAKEVMPVSPVATPTVSEPNNTEVVESSVEIITSAPVVENPADNTPTPQPLIPNVSSPF